MTESTKIAALNDEFRTSLSGGKIYKTDGIDSLDADVQGKILEAVRMFADFTAVNACRHLSIACPSAATSRPSHFSKCTSSRPSGTRLPRYRPLFRSHRQNDLCALLHEVLHDRLTHASTTTRHEHDASGQRRIVCDRCRHRLNLPR